MLDSLAYVPTPRNAIKVIAEDDATLKIGGYLVVFDDPDSPQKDLSGDYFTRDTDFGPARELKSTGQLFHHGLPLKDGTVFDAPLPLLKMSEDEVGIFVETTYQMADEYHRAVGLAIKNSIEKGKPFGWSSSTALQTYKRADDGRILKWWLIEGSPTPTPCEPRTAVDTAVLGKAVPLSSLLPTTKAESLTARMDAVYSAFWQLLDSEAPYDWDSYVAEVWDEFIIVRVEAIVGAGWYRVPYTLQPSTTHARGIEAVLAPTDEWEAVQPQSGQVTTWEAMKSVFQAFTPSSPDGSNSSGPAGLLGALKSLDDSLAHHSFNGALAESLADLDRRLSA